MKLFLASAVLFLSVAAKATPAVGDYSEFQLTVSQGAQSMVGSYILAIVAEAGDSVSMTTTVRFQGQADQVKQDQAKKAQLISDAQIADVLANCGAYGGAPEQAIVPAGTIPTCKLPQQDEAGKESGAVWIGTVPFGIVKQIQNSPEGVVYTLELKKFIVGK